MRDYPDAVLSKFQTFRPVVVVGAPLGSWLASKVTTSTLTYFIALLAAIELASTVVFLEELRTDPAVLAFGVVGLGAVVFGVRELLAVRSRIATERSPQSRTIRRLDLERGLTR